MPLLLPSIFSSIRVFSNESALPIRWPKYWSFSISPSNEYSGLIFFKIDCFDLLAVQGTLKSLLHHHNLKASILQHSAFFMVQGSHPYTTTGKTIALTIYVPLLAKRCLCFLICYLGLSLKKKKERQRRHIATKACCDFGAQENKVFHCFHVFFLYLPESDGARCHDLSSKILEWAAIPSSSGPCFVRTLHCDLSILGGPAWHGS